MGVVEEDFEWVWSQVGEVVGGEFFESVDKVVGGVLGAGGVFVCFEFVFAGKDTHADGEEV